VVFPRGGRPIRRRSAMALAKLGLGLEELSNGGGI